MNAKLECNEEFTIQRCPHDKENPYVMVSRDLIRNNSISPTCRWLIMYLLSMKDVWKISTKQLMDYVKPYMKREKFYKIFNEAISAGYIKREDLVMDGRFAGIKYFISETPKFKNNLPNADLPHAVFPHPEKQHAKDISLQKKEHALKKEHNLPPKVPSSFSAAAAKDDDDVSSSSSAKFSKAAVEIDPHIKQLAEKIFAILKKATPQYRRPRALASVYATLTELVVDDNQPEDDILQAVEYAANDTTERGDEKFCWSKSAYSDFFLIPRPIKKGSTQDGRPGLIKGYLRLCNDMKCKKHRRYAACSDDKRAMKDMDALEESAL